MINKKNNGNMRLFTLNSNPTMANMEEDKEMNTDEANTQDTR